MFIAPLVADNQGVSIDFTVLVDHFRKIQKINLHINAISYLLDGKSPRKL